MKNFIQSLEKILVCLLLLLVYISSVGKTKFHADESQWIATSSVFEEFFSGRFNSAQFKDSYWTRIQPPNVRYVIGLGRRLGGFRPPDLNTPWDFLDDAKENIARNALPSKELLWWSRSIMAFLASASMFITYLLLQHSFSRVASYSWIIFCLVNPFFLQTFSRAMSESVLLAGVTLCWITGWFALRSVEQAKSYGRMVFWMSAMGFSVGITAGAKFNGFSLLGAVILIAGAIAIKMQDRSWLRIGMFTQLSLISILCMCVGFMAFNPYLWTSTFQRLSLMLNMRIGVMDGALVGHASPTMLRWQDRLFLLPHRVFVDLTSLRGPYSYFFNLSFFLIGLAYVAVLVMGWFKDKNSGATPLSLLFVAATAALPSVLSKLDWGRYFFLPVFFSLVFIAIGVNCLAMYVATMWRSWGRNFENEIHKGASVVSTPKEGTIADGASELIK